MWSTLPTARGHSGFAPGLQACGVPYPLHVGILVLPLVSKPWTTEDRSESGAKY